MIIKIFKCDICGVETQSGMGCLRLSVFNGLKGTDLYNIAEHVCDDCFDQYLSFIKNSHMEILSRLRESNEDTPKL